MQAEEIYKHQKIGSRSGYGKRPALVVVDFVNGFNDADVLGGGNISSAISHTQKLLSSFRGKNLPIIFTRIVYAAESANAGVFCEKMPTLAGLTEDHPGGQIVPELTPLAGEIVIRKTQPSAFFGTDLAGSLIRKNVDTVVVVGCTTSGCVRATVVDAMSWNFRVIVPRECVGDRAIAPHEANLFDMDAKYADVAPLSEVNAYIARLE